jgi:hypothetical protein
VAFGVVGLMLGGGLTYLALWAAGIYIDHSKANFGPVNGADHWLHFGLGGVMVLLGLTPRRSARPDQVA